jgi:hypothetical protein
MAAFWGPSKGLIAFNGRRSAQAEHPAMKSVRDKTAWCALMSEALIKLSVYRQLFSFEACP